jgi:UPF0148 protein
MSGEDKKIQMITRLLEKGGTMLATHHECGAPMFRYQGKVLCPVCDYEEKPDKEQKIETIKKIQNLNYDQVASSTRNKIIVIAESLEDETDLERVKRKMECIETGIRILKLLEDSEGEP